MHIFGLRAVTVIPSRQTSSLLLGCLHLIGRLHNSSCSGGGHTGSHGGGHTGLQAGGGQAGLSGGGQTGLQAGGGHTGLQACLSGCGQAGLDAASHPGPAYAR